MKKIAIFFLITFISVYLLLLFFSYFNSPTGIVPPDGVFFSIQNGESLKKIALRLEEKKLIKSALFVQLLGKIRGTDTLFKSGTYKILPDYSVSNLYDLFIIGSQDASSITIPEGWTIKKIARFLEQKKICLKDDFIKATHTEAIIKKYQIPAASVEGYLFPDTYFLPQDYPAESVVNMMISSFFNKIQQLAPGAEEWDRQKLHEYVILASIVEREYRLADEAPLIASVFRNRIKHNIGLESCATVEYIITEILNRPHPQYISKEDLKIHSPYNTYKWAGLPPGPISNPGQIALNAVFHTPETKFFYFVLKDPVKGRHFFSNDLEDHIRAKYYYLK